MELHNFRGLDVLRLWVLSEMGLSMIVGAYDDHSFLGTWHYMLKVEVSIGDQVHLTTH